VSFAIGESRSIEAKRSAILKRRGYFPRNADRGRMIVKGPAFGFLQIQSASGGEKTGAMLILLAKRRSRMALGRRYAEILSPRKSKAGRSKAIRSNR